MFTFKKIWTLKNPYYEYVHTKVGKPLNLLIAEGHDYEEDWSKY